MAGQANIGRAELEVLDFVHARGSTTVPEAAAHFAASKGYARTTVLNVMVRLWRKKFLTRRRTGVLHVYSPRIPKPQLLRRLVGDFVNQTLGGSISPFVAYLAEEAKDLTDSDRKELASLLRQLDRKEKP